MNIIPLPFETVALTGWTHKIRLYYTDVNATAGASKTVTIFPDTSGDFDGDAVTPVNPTTAQLPAGFAVTRSQMQLVTPFLGGAVSAVTLTVGDLASAARYLASANTDLFTATGAGGTNTKDNVVGGAGYAFASADVTNSNANLTATIASTGANLTALTQGEVDIFLCLVDPNDQSQVTGT